MPDPTNCPKCSSPVTSKATRGKYFDFVFTCGASISVDGEKTLARHGERCRLTAENIRLRRANAGLIHLHDDETVLRSLTSLVLNCRRCHGCVTRPPVDVVGGEQWPAEGDCPVCSPVRTWLRENFEVELPVAAGAEGEKHPSYAERVEHGDHHEV